MKVKQRTDDFRVEELSPFAAGADGRFCLYRMTKRGIGTAEALRIVAHEWRVARRDVGFAGLKDKYGETAQTVSIRGGPATNFEGRGFRLNYLGRSERPVARGALDGNRFRIRLRDLALDEAARVRERAEQAAATGFPDYYDDQRFGSLRGTGGRFIARALLDGDAETALRLAIASPHRKDRSKIKARRKRLQAEWGRWDRLAERLDESFERRVVAALAQGASFEDAYGMIGGSIRELHLSAFQAHLFNDALRRNGGDGPRHDGVAGAYVFGDGDAIRDASIPLASADAEPHPLLDEALERAGLTRDDLARLPFRRGRRPAWVVPQDVEIADPEDDDANEGRLAVKLAFTLRPGSYATMLVKRCTFDM